ncbi:hypothetical protein CKM354_000123000 [Cercospora kikuchii]|uniref:F-box domain-containing protein n=1 Tax=Cercospora kikuchii TaxID=84275 RepID=A0A9P3C7V3_9PEZI|nr:uncharacterized protein CKM354_000123000 [Cercospora kikuchii]GIZ37796.1 hypothetical protein CKM354_000123000 [Cercospora kikuchii]
MRLEAKRKAVLDTVELLENILVHLPYEEIYKSRLVSKYWKDVVTNSPSIKERLFLCNSKAAKEVWRINYCRPAHIRLPPPELRGYQAVSPNTPISSPLPREELRNFTYPQYVINHDETITVRPARLNHFLSKKDIEKQVIDECRHNGIAELVKLRLFSSVTREFGETLRLLREAATSEDLPLSSYLCDPPATAAFYHTQLEAIGPKGVAWYIEKDLSIVEKAVGLTTKDLIRGFLEDSGDFEVKEGSYSSPSTVMKRTSSLSKLIDELLNEGCTGLSMDPPLIGLFGVTIPSEQEREAVKPFKENAAQCGA